METIVVYVNDAAHARSILQPMLAEGRPARWVVVACAPRLTRRIGKWVARSTRQQWRQRWSEKVFDQVVPMLSDGGASEVETHVASIPLHQLSAELLQRYGNASRVLDARRPRVGDALPPAVKDQPVEPGGRWSSQIVAASGLCAVLALTD